MTILRLITTSFILSIGGYALYKYEYLTSLSAVDNIISAIAVALVFAGVFGTSVLVWIKHFRQHFTISIVLVFIVVLSIILFPIALRNNWWIIKFAPPSTISAPDIAAYMPFGRNSKAAKLDKDASLQLASHLPVLDGAIALYPLYAAFAQATYSKDSFSQDKILCTNTLQAYDAIISGERDVIFVAGPSKQQLATAKAAGADLHFTPIGREAFVFLVGQTNPVNNITYQQIRNIYSGKTAYWKTLGWAQGGRILAFQRPEGSGSQTGLQNIMGKLPIQSPQPLPDASLIGSNSLMKQVSLWWRGVQPALGYSYRFWATVMYPNPEAKLLKVNGIYPSTENIKRGDYIFANNFYAVTNGPPKGNTQLLINWILSAQGQELIDKTGYVPIK